MKIQSARSLIPQTTFFQGGDVIPPRFQHDTYFGPSQHITTPMRHEPAPSTTVSEDVREWLAFPEEFQIGVDSYFVPRWQCIGIVALAVGIAVLAF